MPPGHAGTPDHAGTAVYTASYRVRFDEAGPDGTVRASSLLRYTQDLAARHSESLGYGRSWYATRGITWLVRCAELDVERPIPYGTVLAGTTRVVGFRRVWSRRETTFALPDGAAAATVRIDWVLIDRAGRPARIPGEVIGLFGADAGERLELARVDLPEPPAAADRRTLTVRPHELDPMDHVNNGVYGDWVEEAVIAAAGSPGPVRAIPRSVRLEYAQAAEPGARLESCCWPAEDGWSVMILPAGGGAPLLRARVEPRGGPPGEGGGHALG